MTPQPSATCVLIDIGELSRANECHTQYRHSRAKYEKKRAAFTPPQLWRARFLTDWPGWRESGAHPSRGRATREDRHTTHGRVPSPLRPVRGAGRLARVRGADHLADRLPAGPAAARDRGRPRGYGPRAGRPGRGARPGAGADENRRARTGARA